MLCNKERTCFPSFSAKQVYGSFKITEYKRQFPQECTADVVLGILFQSSWGKCLLCL